VVDVDPQWKIELEELPHGRGGRVTKNKQAVLLDANARAHANGAKEGVERTQGHHTLQHGIVLGHLADDESKQVGPKLPILEIHVEYTRRAKVAQALPNPLLGTG
jgi:hypothetical protein